MRTTLHMPRQRKQLRQAVGRGMLTAVRVATLWMLLRNTPMRHTPSIPQGQDHCSLCGAVLIEGYYSIQDDPARYCRHCMATSPRCDNCGAPVGDRFWTLHDRRIQCERCHTTALYDATAAQQIYAQTVSDIVQQLGLALRVGVAFRLVDAPTLEHIRSTDSTNHAGERTLGLYHRHGSMRAIYMLYGLPKLTFRMVVAHEYAHAWQGETCPLLDDDELREGFAEWVAYQHLLFLGCTKAARRMLHSHHPYRPFLERVLAIEARQGMAGLIDSMLAIGRGAA